MDLSNKSLLQLPLASLLCHGTGGQLPPGTVLLTHRTESEYKGFGDAPSPWSLPGRGRSVTGRPAVPREASLLPKLQPPQGTGRRGANLRRCLPHDRRPPHPWCCGLLWRGHGVIGITIVARAPFNNNTNVPCAWFSKCNLNGR